MVEGYAFRTEPVVENGVTVAWDAVAEDTKYVIRFRRFPSRDEADAMCRAMTMLPTDFQQKYVALQVIADGVQAEPKEDGKSTTPRLKPGA